MCKFFVALNFRSLVYQRKLFNDNFVKNGDARTSCCYAIVTEVPTKRSSGLYGISCTARASSLPLCPPFVESSTSRFSVASTSRRNGERQRSFEIGESICGLEESQNLMDCERSTAVLLLVYTWLTVKNYPL